MNATVITIIILIILIIIGILLLVFYKPASTSPTQSEVNEFIAQAELYGAFTTPVPVSSAGVRSQCNVYTFQNSTPSYDPTIVNTITPTSLVGGCIDPDQIYALEATHTCQANVINPKAQSFCVGINGNHLTTGQTETFYSTGGCDAKICEDSTLALIALNFNPSAAENNPFCVSISTNSDAIATGELCNPQDANQQFRITRALPPKLTPSSIGPIAQILDRRTGQCLEPNKNNNLVLTQCSVNQGYSWILVPPLTNSPQQIAFTTSPQTFPPLSQIVQYINTQNPQVMTLSQAQAGSPIILGAFESGNIQGQFLSAAQVVDTTLFNTLIDQPTTQYPIVPIPPNS